MSIPPPSRYSQAPPSRCARQAQPRGISCNKCSRPLTTTLFVCSCDCVFCEECTYSHFETSSICPSCSRTLNPDDFMELAVVNPTPATAESGKHALQMIFTKVSPNAQIMSQEEACIRFLKSVDENRRTVRFLLKQLIVDSKNGGEQSGDLRRAYDSLSQKFTELKSAFHTQGIEKDRAIEELQQRLQTEQQRGQAKQQNLDAKDIQIRQLRQLCAQETGVLVPNSSHSQGSVGSRSGGAPPMRGFIMQKEARERDKQMALESMKFGSGPLKNRHRSDVDSIVTQANNSQHQRLHHSQSAGSGGSGGYVFTKRASQSFPSERGSQPLARGHRNRNPNEQFYQTSARGHRPNQSFGYQAGRR